MGRFSHPAVDAMPEAEIGLDGWCTIEVARWEFGLSESQLWQLMNENALPWKQPGKARLICRRALTIHGKAEYQAAPEVRNPKMPSPPPPRRRRTA